MIGTSICVVTVAVLLAMFGSGWLPLTTAVLVIDPVKRIEATPTTTVIVVEAPSARLPTFKRQRLPGNRLGAFAAGRNKGGAGRQRIGNGHARGVGWPVVRGRERVCNWLPAFTGLGEAVFVRARSAWTWLTKFVLKTIGPTALTGPISPSLAFAPLMSSWIAPTLEKLAPWPPPVVKFEKETNWVLLLFSEPSVVFVMGNAGPRPVGGVAIDLEHDEAVVVVRADVQVNARIGALRGQVDSAQAGRVQDGGVAVVAVPVDPINAVGGRVGGEVEHAGEVGIRPQRNAAPGRGELHVQVAMAADGLRRHRGRRARLAGVIRPADKLRGR